MLAEFILIPAGVAVAAGAGGTPAVVPAPDLAANGGVKGTSASSPGSTIGQQLASVGVVTIGGSTIRSRLQSKLSVIAESTQPLQLDAPASNPVDQAVQSKLDEIKRYGEAAYNKLSAEAKKAAAKAMNSELNLDPPLNGTETWSEIIERSTPALAAKGGAAIGEAFGGPAGAALGQAVGKYLGVKIEDLLAKDLPGIKAWFASKWADIENTVEGAVHDAVHKVESWFDSIF